MNIFGEGFGVVVFCNCKKQLAEKANKQKLSIYKVTVLLHMYNIKLDF